MKCELVDFDTYLKNLKELQKKFNHVINDIENICQELVLNPTQLATPIPAYHRKLWKIRIPSTDMKRGKRGGFRTIFYYDEDAPCKVYRLTVYVKVERENLKPQELQQLYKRFMKYLKSSSQKTTQKTT
ncbi:hypothetical protein ES705_06372 [subsurface metagenome]